MNGFRMTVLALLVLVVGAMFYAIFVFLPGMQADRNIYEISRNTAANAQREADHRVKVSGYGESPENEELASEAAAADAAARKTVYEAEERAVIEEAKRKAEAALEREVQEADEAGKAIGLVTSFNKDWVSIMFKPVVKEPLGDGTIVAVRREGVVLCEAVVDLRDEESGQLGATMKPQEFGKAQANIDEAKLLPQPGDEVIYSPFASARDLRADNSFLRPAPLSVPRRDAAQTE